MVMCDGKVVNLQLWDTAGQEDYDRLRPLSYPGTQVFLLCYSVISKASYENCENRWIPELKHHCPEIPIILVGTKIDIREEDNPNHIPTSDGNKLAKKLDALSYVECSAKCMTNVNGVFDAGIRYICLFRICVLFVPPSTFYLYRAVLNPKKKKNKKKKRCTIL